MERAIEFWKPAPGCDFALKPCPFCGGHEVVYEKYQHAVGERWRVVCMGCMAGVDPGWAQQRSDVQILWNKRCK